MAKYGMRWTEITEARQAALYHYMDETKAAYCFEHDVMEARWSHLFDGRRIKGNSFSRNANYTMPRPIRLVMNQMALASRYKIIPLDGERTFLTTLRHDMGIDREVTIRDRSHHAKKDKALQEEFVLGDIAPLSRFITSIEINDRPISRAAKIVDFFDMVSAYSEKHGIELKVHPDFAQMVANVREIQAYDRQFTANY